MTAAIFSIGTEITRGEILNTNASWLSAELTALGFEVLETVSVDDHPGRIVAALRRLAESHAVVVATGGLGPTTDDLTAAAVAQALGVPLVRDPASLEAIRRRFEAAGRTMSPTNEKQADFPDGAEVLPNPVGTAPGFSVALGGCRAFFLPGVPREMKRIFADHIVPENCQACPAAHFSNPTEDVRHAGVARGREARRRRSDISWDHDRIPRALSRDRSESARALPPATTMHARSRTPPRKKSATGLPACSMAKETTHSPR